MSAELELGADEVLALRTAHTPTNQDEHDYDDRCGLCGYTRHPCDVFSLARDWLTMWHEANR